MCVYEDREYIGTPVLSPLFCCEPKIAHKNKTKQTKKPYTLLPFKDGTKKHEMMNQKKHETNLPKHGKDLHKTPLRGIKDLSKQRAMPYNNKMEHSALLIFQFSQMDV